MDVFMLTEIFRRLCSVKVLQIDNGSSQAQAEVMDAIRCGSKFIFDKEDAWVDGHSREMGYNRSFGVVLRCAERAELAKEGITIKLEATVRPALSHYVEFFDPTLPAWTDSFAGLVSSLKLCVQEDTPWGIDLLRSVRNLRRLQLCSCNDDNHFSHPTSGLLIWPHLHHLNLSDLPCAYDALVTFFEAHQDNLTQLHLQHVILNSGTWRSPLNFILQLPRLDCLSLCNLLTEDELSLGDNSFSSFYDVDDSTYQTLLRRESTEVQKGVSAVLHDFRTVIHAIDDSRVDLRLAAAVMSGEAELYGHGYKVVSAEGVGLADGEMSVEMRGLRSWWESK